MKKGPFKMKGFGGFGNSPVKVKTVRGSAGATYDKAKNTQKQADAAYQTYATRPHRTPDAKANKMLNTGNTLQKKADTQFVEANKQRKIFKKGMSIQRERMQLNKPKAKKSGGKIYQTPKPKSRTQKVVDYFMKKFK